jgi:hypothetical protein
MQTSALEQGACVATSLGPGRECDYSIAFAPGVPGKPEWIRARRFEKVDSRGNLTWATTDEIVRPVVPHGYRLMYMSCALDGAWDQTLIVVARDMPVEGLWRDVLWAKRLDLVSGKFVPVTPASVFCISEGEEGGNW